MKIPGNAQLVVTRKQEGVRLEHILAQVLPGTALRERRRLWEYFRITVDGRVRPRGYRVQAGQHVVVSGLKSGPKSGLTSGLTSVAQQEKGPTLIPEGVRVIAQETGLLAGVYKPAGLHSEALAGRPGPAVSSCLDAFWPGGQAHLLNRLDYLTSGIVLVALCAEAGRRYRLLEETGQVYKEYLAVVHGHVHDNIIVDRALDTAHRRVVRVLETTKAAALRTTQLSPVSYDAAANQSLVRAVIQKGARHQIRAHLAFLGHAVVGDPLYGTCAPEAHPNKRPEVLHLHHGLIRVGTFQAKVLSPWQFCQQTPQGLPGK